MLFLLAELRGARRAKAQGTDATIFPVVLCANTDFPTLMVAEKIASAIPDWFSGGRPVTTRTPETLVQAVYLGNAGVASGTRPALSPATVRRSHPRLRALLNGALRGSEEQRMVLLSLEAPEHPDDPVVCVDAQLRSGCPATTRSESVGVDAVVDHAIQRWRLTQHSFIECCAGPRVGND